MPRDPKIVTPIEWIVNDGAVKRFFDEVLIERLREDRSLTSLEEHAGLHRSASRSAHGADADYRRLGAVRAEPRLGSRAVGRLGNGRMPSVAAASGPRWAARSDEAIDWQRCLIEMNRLVSSTTSGACATSFEGESQQRELLSGRAGGPGGLRRRRRQRAGRFRTEGAAQASPILGRDQDRLRNRVWMA